MNPKMEVLLIVLVGVAVYFYLDYTKTDFSRTKKEPLGGDPTKDEARNLKVHDTDHEFTKDSSASGKEKQEKGGKEGKYETGQNQEERRPYEEIKPKEQPEEKVIEQQKQKEKVLEQQKQKERVIEQQKQKEKAIEQQKQKERVIEQQKQKEKLIEQQKQKEKVLEQQKQKEKALEQQKQKEKFIEQQKQKEKAIEQQKQKEKVLEQQKQKAAEQEERDKKEEDDMDGMVHIAVVACGDRLPETITLIKSAVLTSLQPENIKFHVFTDAELRKEFTLQLRDIPVLAELYDIQFPDTGDSTDWRELFKPCASQRLFIPMLLQQVDRLLYVDTDILFLRPVEHLFDEFKHFNSTHVAAMSAEHEQSNAGWYNRFAMHPYYGDLGVNSGVMLMHLARIRRSDWLPRIAQYHRTYRYNITWGDQDLLNIYFHYSPEQLYTFRCDYNYRPDHCMYGQNCDPIRTEGIAVLHGNRRSFHNDKYPVFKIIYDSFARHVIGDPFSSITKNIQSEMSVLEAPSYCDKELDLFMKHLDIHAKPGVRSFPPNALSEPVASEPASLHLVVVACGDRQPETVVLMKSALLFTRQHVVFHVFTEQHLMPAFRSHMESLPHSVKKRFTLMLHLVAIPEDSMGLKWRTLFKPCASQRLFLPTLMSGIDSILYVDTDILFINSLEDIFSHFSLFNSSQLIGSASETDELTQTQSWYTRKAKHPFYGPNGINSGVMLMNLTRLRKTDFVKDIASYYKEFVGRIPWGDQDLLNIYFGRHPDQIYIYSCAYNYRNDHCISGPLCSRVDHEGISVLHGSRRIFQADTKWPTPAFRSMYVEIEKFNFKVSLKNLEQRLLTAYDSSKNTACGQQKQAFFHHIKRNVEQLTEPQRT